jgi:predicted lipoprotein with Yx(FWY)xxD motif
MFMMEGDRMRTRGILLAFALFVTACGGGTDLATETTTAAPTTANTAAPAGSSEGVALVETSLGPVLVGPNGMTLYGFTVDVPGVSNCYDSCAQTWPPLSGDTPIGDGIDPALFSTTERTDGTTQLVIGDWPLYYFSGDVAPGDTNGHLIEGIWFAVTQAGELVGGGTIAGDDVVDTSDPPVDDYDY